MKYTNDPELPVFPLQEFVAILQRRRAVILQVFLLSIIVGVITAITTRPLYQASARLLVDEPSNNLDQVDGANPLSGLFTMSQAQTISSQVEMLQAQPLLSKAAQRTGPAMISVSMVHDTNIIEVTAESPNPVTAAAAPNTLLDLYLAEDADRDLGAIRNARAFLIEQEMDTHKNLLASEGALSAFKNKYNLPDLERNRSDQIARATELTNAYQKAVTELSALQAEIALDRHLMALEPADLISQVRVTNSRIAALDDSIGNLQVQREAITQPGGLNPNGDAPALKALDAQIAALKSRKAQQHPLAVTETESPNAMKATLHGKIVDLLAQQASLQQQAQTDHQELVKAKAQALQYVGWERMLDDLNRQHDAALAADKNFTAKLSDLSLREKAYHPPAHILVRADVPTAPVRPKKSQTVGLSCVVGLLLGVCFALLQEYLDDRINTPEEADRVLGLPMLGHIPALTSEGVRQLSEFNGQDLITESYRMLRTNIRCSSLDGPLRTLLVTSAGPGEGKTTTAANLAFAMAMDGKKVIVVDADLRRPTLHRLLRLPSGPGLTDVLLGDVRLEDALLQNERLPGLIALTCGTSPPNPGEVLGSDAFHSLVEVLKENADIVIFDSPTMLGAADTQILASHLQSVALVVQTGLTRKAAARQALTLLRHSRANVLGVVFNKCRVLPGGNYYSHYSARGLTAGRGPGDAAALDSTPLLGAEAPTEKQKHPAGKKSVDVTILPEGRFHSTTLRFGTPDALAQRTITVLGAVMQPGAYVFQEGWHVRDALAASGNPSQPIERCRLNLITAGGEDTEIDLARLLTDMDDASNLRLAPGDVLLLKLRDQVLESVQVMGEVTQPGGYQVPPEGVSAADLLQQAGGATKKAALHRAQVRQGGHLRSLDLNPLRAVELRLMPGDSLYIPSQSAKRRTRASAGDDSH